MITILINILLLSVRMHIRTLVVNAMLSQRINLCKEFDLIRN